MPMLDESVDQVKNKKTKEKSKVNRLAKPKLNLFLSIPKGKQRLIQSDKKKKDLDET
jgi:hypothetical protein